MVRSQHIAALTTDLIEVFRKLNAPNRNDTAFLVARMLLEDWDERQPDWLCELVGGTPPSKVREQARAEVTQFLKDRGKAA